MQPVSNLHPMLRPGLTAGFLIGSLILASLLFPALPLQGTLLLAVLAGAYMAMNVGANDAANNIGPAVGSKAITLTGALAIAAIFELAGALIAGGEVVNTIKGGIIDPSQIGDKSKFIWIMLSALLAGALWLHLATALGLPISTTHLIIGGVLGAGITAGGVAIANWHQVAIIATGWVIAPLLAGLIAAGFLYLIKLTITYQANMIKAAKRTVPILVAVMCWAFSVYIILKGLGRIWHVDSLDVVITGLVIAVGIYLIVQPAIIARAERLPNEKSSINRLFNLPLVFAAALLSFAHGANDVANAIGPLAAINETLQGTDIAPQASIPLWEMVIGALGLSLGLLLYGSKVIRTIGSEITEIDQMRAFCIAIAIAITVTLASQLGLPVSSTHAAVGAVFGVGFLREYLKSNFKEKLQRIEQHYEGQDQASIRSLLEPFEKASVSEKARIIKMLKSGTNGVKLSKKESKMLRKMHRQELVKRSMLLKIVSAWLITLPAASLLSALIYLLLQTTA